MQKTATLICASPLHPSHPRIYCFFMLIQWLKTMLIALMRVVFSLEYHGVRNVPTSGAVIVAGNHPSYLDPVLVYLPLRREVRFMAWDALFRIPLAGQFIRAFGAFPVDLRKGKGEAAFQQAVKVLNAGEVLGIFPEGQRSEQAAMGELRTGVARLAIATGAPIVPVTIGGASRAWPKWKLLPKPAKLVVRFHEPIQLDPAEVAERGEDKAYHLEVMERVAERINRSLRPALHEAAHLEKLYAQPPSNIRTYEWAPLLAALIGSFVAWQRGTWPAFGAQIWIPVAAYFLYLAADLTLIKPGRTAKWLRNSMPIWLIVAWHSWLTRATGLPFGERNLWLGAALVVAFFPFFYEDYYSLQKFVRGIVVSYYAALLLMVWQPHPLGVMVAVLVFSLAFYWLQRIRTYQAMSVLLIGVLGAAVWLTEAPGQMLLLFVALAWLVIAYLHTFTSVAYDIRRAGQVSLPE